MAVVVRATPSQISNLFGAGVWCGVAYQMVVEPLPPTWMKSVLGWDGCYPPQLTGTPLLTVQAILFLFMALFLNHTLRGLSFW